MIGSVKPRPNAAMNRFNQALRNVLTVSHDEMERREAEYKASRPKSNAGRKPRSASASGHASDKKA